jgi:hypothetical protein
MENKASIGVGYNITNPNVRTAYDLQQQAMYNPNVEGYMPPANFGRTSYDLAMNSFYNPLNASNKEGYRPPRPNTWDTPYNDFAKYIEYQEMN